MAWDHMTAKSRWDDDAGIERLKMLWAEGHSSTEIGRMMGATKNMVIGKVHRLGLPSRQSPVGVPHEVSEEAKETARKLWAEGHPASAISVTTGIPIWAFSRKRSWLNLPRHGRQNIVALPTLPPLPSVGAVEITAPVVALETPSVSLRLKEVIAMKLPKAVAVPVRVVKPEPTPEPTTTFIARSGKCQWPFGDPGTKEFRFCEAIHSNRSYCNEHAKIAYVHFSPTLAEVRRYV